jgi:hypothetical protein
MLSLPIGWPYNDLQDIGTILLVKHGRRRDSLNPNELSSCSRDILSQLASDDNSSPLQFFTLFAPGGGTKQGIQEHLAHEDAYSLSEETQPAMNSFAAPLQLPQPAQAPSQTLDVSFETYLAEQTRASTVEPIQALDSEYQLWLEECLFSDELTSILGLQDQYPLARAQPTTMDDLNLAGAADFGQLAWEGQRRSVQDTLTMQWAKTPANFK